MELDDKTVKALFERLQRTESRVVRGFTELGVVVTDDDDWCRVDNERREVHINGTGRSIRSIQMAIIQTGGGNDFYDVIVSGKQVATIVA